MKVRVPEIDLILLIMAHLQKTGLIQSLRALEKEAQTCLETYGKDLRFFRELVLDGRLEEASLFIDPLKDSSFDHGRVIFFLQKQRFLELVDQHSQNPEVKEVVASLKALEGRTSQEEFHSLCYCLTLPSLKKHPEYANWDVYRGRHDCFDSCLSHLQKVFPDQVPTESSLRLPKDAPDPLLRLCKQALLYQVHHLRREEPGRSLPDEIAADVFKESINLSAASNSKSQILPAAASTAPPTSSMMTFQTEGGEQDQQPVQYHEDRRGATNSQNMRELLNPSGGQKEEEGGPPYSGRSSVNGGTEGKRTSRIRQPSSCHPSSIFEDDLPHPTHRRPSLTMRGRENETDDFVGRSTALMVDKKPVAWEIPAAGSTANMDGAAATPAASLQQQQQQQQQRLSSSLPAVINRSIPLPPPVAAAAATVERRSSVAARTTSAVTAAEPAPPSSRSQLRRSPSKSIHQHNGNGTSRRPSQQKEQEGRHSLSTTTSYRSLLKTDLDHITPICLAADSHPIRTAIFDLTGQHMAYGSNSGALRLCDIKSLISSSTSSTNHLKADDIDPSSLIVHERYKHHRGSVFCLAWSASSTLLASGSNDKLVKVMKVYSGSESLESEDLTLVGHSGTVRDVTFLGKDSTKLISGGGGDKEVKIWDMCQGTLIKSLSGHTENIMKVLYTGEEGGGGLVISGAEDGLVLAWDMRIGKAVTRLEMPSSKPVMGMACLGSKGQGEGGGGASIIAASHPDGSITLWDLTADQEGRMMIHQEKLFADECRSLAFSSDGQWLLCGSYDSTTLLLSTDQLLLPHSTPSPTKLVHSFKRKAHRGKILSANWHPSAPSFMTTSSDCTVKLWTTI